MCVLAATRLLANLLLLLDEGTARAAATLEAVGAAATFEVELLSDIATLEDLHDSVETSGHEKAVCAALFLPIN